MNLPKYFYPFKTTSIVFCAALLIVLFAAHSILAQNPVAEENENTGTTDWQIDEGREALDREIEGYASATSVDIGSPITFYVSSAENDTIDIEIYRIGFYNGNGGRLIDTIENVSVEPQPQPEADHTTGLIECDWEATETWTPTDVVSGYFLAKLVGTSKDSYIIFVVRDDESESDFVFQSAVTTYQAYNFFPGNLDQEGLDWGSGKSLYNGERSFGPLVPEYAASQYKSEEARMVSFNRPYLAYNDNIYTSAGQFFDWEYLMVRWMEEEGLDVSYITNVDTHADPGNFAAGKHKAFLTAGHDEYYSWQMRNNLEQARNRSSQPLHLGFFSSNDVYWQIRFANSSSSNTAPANAPYRTIICYKLHVDDSEWGDPNRVNDSDFVPVLTDNHEITQKWRDNRMFQQTCTGGGTGCYKDPEDELVGAMTYEDFVQGYGDFTLSAECPSWVSDGMTSSTLEDLVGYEPIRIFDKYPSRERIMIGESEATCFISGCDQPDDEGVAHSVYYKMNTGGRVFSAGSNYWATGFYNTQVSGLAANVRTMTMNILDCFKNGGSACDE